MDEKVRALLNEQVNKELFSSYLYLAFSNYYADANLDGFAHWFCVQSQEEIEHAFKFLKYLKDNDQKVTLETIPAPKCDFSDFRAPLAAAFEHEKYVTNLIHTIYHQARQVEDFRCCQFLEWFIAEQCEEEKNARDLISKYDLFGDQKGLFLLNADLKVRRNIPIDFSVAMEGK